jgi:hypothetical protein
MADTSEFDWIGLLKRLIGNNVEFVVIGGAAATLRNKGRWSP